VQAAEDRTPPAWENLLQVYETALEELVELRDPRLNPLIEDLARLRGRATIELHLSQRAERHRRIAGRIRI